MERPGVVDGTARLRRPHVWVPLLVFLGTTFAFMPQAMLGTRTYLAVDFLEQTSPYREAIERPPVVKSPSQLDQVSTGVTGPIAFARALKHGDWLNWDPRVAAGQPAGFGALNGALSPFFWPLFVVPGWYGIGMRIMLAFLFCQWFMFLFLRRLGVGVWAGIVGAVAYTYTGTNLVLLQRVTAVFVLPALMWAVHRLARRGRPRDAVVFGAFVAWTWFEGFPSAAVYCVVTAVLFGGWLIAADWWHGRAGPDDVAVGPSATAVAVRRVVALGVGCAFGLGVAMVNALPLSHEVSARSLLESRVFGHLNPINLFGLASANIPGPVSAAWLGLLPEEAGAYLGLAVVALVIFGLVQAVRGRLPLRRDARTTWGFVCVLATVVTVCTYVGGPILDLVYAVPGFANNPIWRSRFLIGFAAAVLLAITTDAVWRRRGADAPHAPADPVPPELSPASASPRWVSLGLLALGAAAVVAYFPNLLDAARVNGNLGFSLLRDDAYRNVPMAALAIGIVIVGWRRPRLVPVCAVALTAVVFVQIAWPLRDFTPSDPVSDFYTEQAAHTELHDLLGDRYRFMATYFNYMPNSMQVLDLADTRGTALFSPEYRALIRAVAPTAFNDDAFKIVIPREGTDVASPVLDDLAVRYFVLGTSDVPFGAVVHDDEAWSGWYSEAAAAALPGFVASGPIDGIEIPVRASGVCDTGSAVVELRSRNRVLATSRRPLYDVDGDWLSFAILAHDVAPGDVVQPVVRSTSPACHLEVGKAVKDPRVAVRLYRLGPSDPVELVSTTQSWIYERPSAFTIVSAHARWRGFPDQASALAYLASRPASERDVIAYVGSGPEPDPSAEPARVAHTKIGAGRVQVDVRGDSVSLLNLGQSSADGWKVRIDGKDAPLVLVDGGLIATFVPAGRHHVEASYQPRSFTIGAAVTIFTLAIAALGGLLTLVRNRRARRSPVASP